MGIVKVHAYAFGNMIRLIEKINEVHVAIGGKRLFTTNEIHKEDELHLFIYVVNKNNLDKIKSRDFNSVFIDESLNPFFEPYFLSRLKNEKNTIT